MVTCETAGIKVDLTLAMANANELRNGVEEGKKKARLKSR